MFSIFFLITFPRVLQQLMPSEQQTKSAAAEQTVSQTPIFVFLSIQKKQFLVYKLSLYGRLLINNVISMHFFKKTLTYDKTKSYSFLKIMFIQLHVVTLRPMSWQGVGYVSYHSVY